ncbi:MAG: hypothetical protein RMI93_07215, partial [Caldimicrobium sp.]|nr:hypothetical protein [Caldimicrobium sp.]MDW8183373.1 hypothetical protein [Caldimicrobium sp.]
MFRKCIFLSVIFVLLISQVMVQGQVLAQQAGVQPQVQPQGAQPQGVQPARRTILDFREELRLTEDQFKKIKKIVEDFEKKANALNERAV